MNNISIIKQSEYNIEINNYENGRKITKYIEAKTHTRNNIQNRIIRLFYQKYCMLRKYKDYYADCHKSIILW